MGHRSDDAATEAVFGKVSIGFTDREVAADLTLDYDMAGEDSLEGMQVAGCYLRRT
jgi:hypothetical protein